MCVTSISWWLAPSSSRYLSNGGRPVTGARGLLPVPEGSASYLWLLERRQTIVSDFSEFPKLTRKVAP